MAETPPPILAPPSIQPTTTTTTPSLLSTHKGLVETISSFLTVATHHIIFLRRIYPPISFLSVRAYNYAVRQNRHPAVCAWINDAISAVRDQLEKNTVERVSLCIYECRGHRVLEKWTFDLHSIPSVAKIDRDTPFVDTTTTSPPETTGTDQWPPLAEGLNVADLEANFRATLARISTAAGKLKPLPQGLNAPECSFTLAMEVKDDADRPVGMLEPDERRWMAAETRPSTATATDTASAAGDRRAGDAEGTSSSSAQTHVVRRLETGELRMEVWVEESAAKFEYDLRAVPQPGAAGTRRVNFASSDGAGTAKVDRPADKEYDLEPPDVNRKPQGGAMTDYQRDR
ncbi:hypothetical protein H2204_014009 [Knufia peltigerae]|uniref:HORMA domain-containing protein n=1 Tax=Knufia peltigerae TaxID=1002370 RepID=A0AA39CPT7_9EURO|nr:hypothetical protein H2204_014009 [Knufia peltigerae]